VGGAPLGPIAPLILEKFHSKPVIMNFYLKKMGIFADGN
jgi:hypothetical protein